jgi:hypothetical protein
MYRNSSCQTASTTCRRFWGDASAANLYDALKKEEYSFVVEILAGGFSAWFRAGRIYY